MQRLLSLKEENSTLLIPLRFVFWALFSVEESAYPQPISIRISYHPRKTDNRIQDSSCIPIRLLQK